jgi:hypothetical protein
MSFRLTYLPNFYNSSYSIFAHTLFKLLNSLFFKKFLYESCFKNHVCLFFKQKLVNA